MRITCNSCKIVTASPRAKKTLCSTCHTLYTYLWRSILSNSIDKFQKIQQTQPDFQSAKSENLKLIFEKIIEMSTCSHKNLVGEKRGFSDAYCIAYPNCRMCKFKKIIRVAPGLPKIKWSGRERVKLEKICEKKMLIAIFVEMRKWIGPEVVPKAVVKKAGEESDSKTKIENKWKIPNPAIHYSPPPRAVPFLKPNELTRITHESSDEEEIVDVEGGAQTDILQQMNELEEYTERINIIINNSSLNRAWSYRQFNQPETVITEIEEEDTSSSLVSRRRPSSNTSRDLSLTILPSKISKTSSSSLVESSTSSRITSKYNLNLNFDPTCLQFLNWSDLAHALETQFFSSPKPKITDNVFKMLYSTNKIFNYLQQFITTTFKGLARLKTFEQNSKESHTIRAEVEAHNLVATGKVYFERSNVSDGPSKPTIASIVWEQEKQTYQRCWYKQGENEKLRGSCSGTSESGSLSLYESDEPISNNELNYLIDRQKAVEKKDPPNRSRITIFTQYITKLMFVKYLKLYNELIGFNNNFTPCPHILAGMVRKSLSVICSNNIEEYTNFHNFFLNNVAYYQTRMFILMVMYNFDNDNNAFYAHTSNVFFDYEDVQEYLLTTFGNLKFSCLTRRLKNLTQEIRELSDSKLAMINVIITGVTFRTSDKGHRTGSTVLDKQIEKYPVSHTRLHDQSYHEPRLKGNLRKRCPVS